MPTARTVILDESCDHLSAAVRQFAKTYTFRRRTGFLSPALAAAEELRAVLSSGALEMPAIYVAPSYAAFTALLLAQRGPKDLAGILLVDPSHPDQGSVALSVLSSAEVPPSPEVERLKAFLSGFGPVWDEACRQVSAIRELGDVPLLVLAGGRVDLPDADALPPRIKDRLIHDRHEMLARYASLSTAGFFRIVPQAGHDISRDVPEAVIDAIHWLFAQTHGKATSQTPESVGTTVMPPAGAGDGAGSVHGSS